MDAGTPDTATCLLKVPKTSRQFSKHESPQLAAQNYNMVRALH